MFTSGVKILYCALTISAVDSVRRNSITFSGSLESLPSTEASLKELASG